MVYVLAMMLITCWAPPPLFDTDGKPSKFGTRESGGTIFSLGVVSLAVATLAFVGAAAYNAGSSGVRI